MTVNGIKQNITAIPFSSENGMCITAYDESSDKDIEKVLNVNDIITWLNGDERITGHIYDENHILVEKGEEIEILEVPYGSLMEDVTTFRGILTEGKEKFDIRYSANDIQALHENLYISSFIPEEGTLPEIKYLGSMDIEISVCKGIIDGIGFQMLSREIVNIEGGGELPRIDSVVLVKDQANRKIILDVKKGEENIKPKPPRLQTDSFSTYELLICNVMVRERATSLAPNNIEDKRIILYNYYGADYIIRSDWDLQRLCQENISATNAILLTNVTSDNYTIPSSLKNLKTVNNSKIKGNITILDTIVENITFDSGKITTLNSIIENVTFEGGDITMSNTSIEKSIFKSGTITLTKCHAKNTHFREHSTIRETSGCNFENCIFDCKINEIKESCYINDGFVGEIRSLGAAINKIPSGWLLCDGRELERETNKFLFSVIGTTWGSGNGITTFNIPDARSGVLKGIGIGVLEDADRGNRFAGKGGGAAGDNVGSYQRFAFHSHTHNVIPNPHKHEIARSTIQNFQNKGNPSGGHNEGNNYTDEFVRTTFLHIENTGELSTRDNNIGVNFMIKVK